MAKIWIKMSFSRQAIFHFSLKMTKMLDIPKLIFIGLVALLEEVARGCVRSVPHSHRG